MILIVFYSLAIAMGYGLLYLFVKFQNNKKIYYLGWVFAVFILSTISSVMGEPIEYIFESANYEALPTWLYLIFMVFILIPAIFLTYPFVQIYKWIMIMLDDFYCSIMKMFVPNKKDIDEEVR